MVNQRSPGLHQVRTAGSHRDRGGHVYVLCVFVHSFTACVEYRGGYEKAARGFNQTDLEEDVSE